jgi:glycosyltransferase involved in cell wall biosynthesis
MTYSLVSTVLNDAAGVELFFESMGRQTRLPDEIVIVDGGSTDGTWEALKAEAQAPRFASTVIVEKESGCNVARGRDLAIERSKGEIIVSTDIGCQWNPEWFAEQIVPFEGDGGNGVDVVIGSWAVRKEDAKSDWALVEFARRYPFRLEATPESLGINRSIAYRKSVWEKVGGYPQDLTLAADDVVFDMIIRQPKWGFRFDCAPKVRCYWERHETLAQFAKEERRNFFGAGEARIWLKHAILVSGRLAFEALSLVLGIAFLAANLVIPALALFLIFILSFCARIRTLGAASSRLKQLEIKGRWRKLLAFEYLTKVRGMQGYFSGILNGSKHCRQTRMRLRE